MRFRANGSHLPGMPITAKPTPSRSVLCHRNGVIPSLRGISSSVAVVGGGKPIMRETEEIIDQVALVKDGFKPIRDLAGEALANRSEDESLALAHELYQSEVHQARMMATILFGQLAAAHSEAFTFLRDVVSYDPDWRTQEMLAMAFDTYCKAAGYEQALPTIESWLGDPNPNVRRAASEGLRIWTHRPYFKQHPEQAVALLSRLKADEHPYVRKSAGNALRDISRFHKTLVAAEVATWDLGDARIADTYKQASKFLQSD
jgi:3-methyladenine DNA glycosylase AlkD